MPNADPAKKLASLLKRLRSAYAEAAARPAAAPVGFDSADAAVHQLVFSFLLWEASHSHALGAFARLHESLVDYNELRVSFAEELAAIIGEKYPRAEERCARLRACLNELFRREHSVSLSSVVGAGRREARQYVESLEGTPGYVSARVWLLCAGGHAVPVDQRLASLLAAEGCCDAQLSPDSVGAWLERQIKPADAPGAHTLLQAWSDDKGAAPARPEPTRERETPKDRVKDKPARPKPAARGPARPAARQRVATAEKPAKPEAVSKKKRPAKEKPEA
jgi:hypothetical protein